jgi:hypothetical protein
MVLRRIAKGTKYSLQVLASLLLIAFALWATTNATSAQSCQCTPPVPACSWDDCVPPLAVMNGITTLPIVTSKGDCIVTVFWCSRVLNGTPCALPGYGTSCEYKIQKVCFPPECAISCVDVEMNSVLLDLVRKIAANNPASHFIPTSNQWYDPSYRTAWRLGFPACFKCSTDSATGCVSLESCGSSTCYQWNAVYLCLPPNCPSADPPCPNSCPAATHTLNPISKSKTVGECVAPHANCVLCGH